MIEQPQTFYQAGYVCGKTNGYKAVGEAWLDLDALNPNLVAMLGMGDYPFTQKAKRSFWLGWKEAQTITFGAYNSDGTNTAYEVAQ